MKKIIYNTKLKKIIIAILMAVLLMNYIIPCNINFVYAAETTEEEEDSSDVGGILLSPVFFLINFVADAITSNLGRIMIGDDASFSNVTGTNVLQADTIPEESGKRYKEIEAPLEDPLIGSIQYPNIQYTPEEIFSGKIDILSIDFISGKNIDGTENQNRDWKAIRNVISQWYQVLRMIAIIGLLSVLIYTGIKIMLSANAKDKAKYKEWIINWFMAVAILFAMQFIMAFIIAVTGEISKLISGSSQGILIINGDKESATNLMGLVRYMIQSKSFYKKIAYEVMYIALIVYTIKFTILYLKRVLNMAFLTLISPIVALTYPIDKINDGRAQGFDMWIKEYIFNALLQPMHLIMYYILVGSAVTIAATNPIYGIVVLMFLTEAEKLLKRIFGFDKASGGTVGGMAGAFAAGAIASNIKNIARMSKLPSGNAGKGGAGNADGSTNLMDKVKPERDGSVYDDKDGFLNPGLDGGGDSGGGSSDGGSSGGGSPSLDLDAGGSTDAGAAETAMLTGAAASQVDAPSTGSDSSGESEQQPPQIDPSPEIKEELESASEEAKKKEEEEKEEKEEEEEEKAQSIREMAARKYESMTTPEQRDKLGKIGRGTIRGAKNLGKSAIRPLYDIDRKGTGYNAERWKRRGISALKGAGKAAVGFSIGTAAAAVQAGISITDGKYNPLEGIGTFTAGYAGGSKLAGTVGGSIASTFKEGYYDGDEGRKLLIEKKKKEFMYRDDIDRKYREDWKDQAQTMKKLASDHLVPYGYTDTKDQKAILKLAQDLAGKDATPERMEAAVQRARKTKNFMDQLEKTAPKDIITDADKQEKYIKAMIKAEVKDPAADAAKVKRMEDSYRAAFKTAARWQQVNK